MVKLTEVADPAHAIGEDEERAVSASKVMGHECKLSVLQELQREAEALRIRTPESEALMDRTAACKKWTTTIHNQLLRKTSKRSKEKVTKLTCADVETMLQEANTLQLDANEIEQATERLADARNWMGEADKVLNPPIAITQEVMEDLKELSNRAETLNMNLEQQEALDTRLGAVKNWLSRAKAAMNDSSSEWQLLTALVKEAKKSQFNLPEVPLLAEQQAEQAWVGQAEIALSGPAQLEDLQQLDDDSARLAESGRAAEMAKKISIKLAAARGGQLAEEVA